VSKDIGEHLSEKKKDVAQHHFFDLAVQGEAHRAPTQFGAEGKKTRAPEVLQSERKKDCSVIWAARPGEE